MPSESANKLLVQIVRKIPIFQDLSSGQLKQVLGACVYKPCRVGERVCESNTPSDEMYILLSGELAVATQEGVRITTLLPVTMVGEMGVFTGQKRTATVEATKPSNLFTIKKVQLDQMMRDDLDMRVKIYRHIVDTLASKLSNDNLRLRDYQIEKDSCEDRIAMLERQLKDQEQRMEIAMQRAAEAGGISPDEIELYMDDKIKELVQCILIVDDEAEIRRLIKQALASYAVVEAENGLQALDIVQEERLDLVITDIHMPDMDGFGLLTNMRSQFPHLPVLAISGFVDAEEVEGYDFDGFIDKPVSLEQLQNLVEETIARLR